MPFALPTTEHCHECGHGNEAPYLFCQSCGQVRLPPSRWRVTFYLFVTMLVFLAIFTVDQFLAGIINWDWPVFTLYAYFTYRFVCSQTLERFGARVRIATWFLAMYALFMIHIEAFYHWEESTPIFVLLLSEAPGAAQAYPLVFYPLLGAVLVAVFLPLYFSWAHRSGWVNAYRLVMLVMGIVPLACVGGFTLAAWVARQWPALDLAALKILLAYREDYDYALGLFAMVVLRILLFEVLIFAALRSYATVRRADKQHAEKAGQGAFGHSLWQIARMVRRFALVVENMTFYLLRTLRELCRDLFEVGRIFLREVFLPVLAMTAMGLLLFGLTVLTRSYIVQFDLLVMAGIAGSLMALIFVSLVFLWCKTPYRWWRVAAFQWEMIGWTLPNLLLFLPLVSLSLFMTSYFMNSSQRLEEELPYRIGPLTLVCTGLMVALIAYMLVTRRLLFATAGQSARTHGDSAVAEASGTQKTPGDVPAGDGLDTITTKTHKLFDQARSQTREAVGSVRSEVRERLKGKPAIHDKLTKARERVLEKESQMKAIESSRGRLSPETFERIRMEGRSELSVLKVECDHLQREFDKLHQERLAEKVKLEASLAVLDSQQVEFEEMKRIGILKEEDFGRKQKKAQRDRKELLAKLDACRSVLVYLDVLADADTD